MYAERGAAPAPRSRPNQIGIHPVGLSACLVEVADPAWLPPLHRHLAVAHRQGELPDVVDLVPGARTVLLDGLPADTGPALLTRLLAGWTPADTATSVAGAETIDVPVRYDGPDLTEVARLVGIGTDEVVSLHTGTLMTVDFCGFAPGFAYLSGLPEQLRVSRLPAPRTAVPAGAVAIAESYTGIYPRSSPGGWRILGHTDLPLWDADRPEPALLTPGTRVRLVAVS